VGPIFTQALRCGIVFAVASHLDDLGHDAAHLLKGAVHAVHAGLPRPLEQLQDGEGRDEHVPHTLLGHIHGLQQPVAAHVVPARSAWQEA
jgi:hypothetical protein